MRILSLLILLFPAQAFAAAPECPIYSNKKNCLQSVDENYQDLLDFIDKEYIDEKDDLIQAAVDVKHFESLACQKTCLN